MFRRKGGNGQEENYTVHKTFIDTNVFIYTIDQYDRAKQKTARETIRNIVEREIAVISTQVLQEFYSICTTKLHVNPLRAKGYMHSYNENFEVVQNSFEIIERGIDISLISQISFWDALIIAAAEYAKCTEILTEDLNDGQVINGIKIKNLFGIE
jgi:predicted nucleic acid-binding protein